LIFTGTRDKKVRALDSATGKVLWESEVAAAVEGMPAVYEAGGREYVVFCAAAQATTYTHNVPGHPAVQAPIPGAYIAFALPAATTGSVGTNGRTAKSSVFVHNRFVRSQPTSALP